jgi:hypothetical protein
MVGHGSGRSPGTPIRVTYRLDRDECQQVALFRMCEAIVDYDVARGELDHYLSTACWHAMVNFAKSRAREHSSPWEIGPRPFRNDWVIVLWLAGSICN